MKAMPDAQQSPFVKGDSSKRSEEQGDLTLSSLRQAILLQKKKPSCTRKAFQNTLMDFTWQTPQLWIPGPR
ncbi:hypothetical protein GCM10008938_09330 [Deinococcus roseus]|uniref:Transposase n=1 Tax=Deinococcus roseus TaxID=392414 RepID=A0ABQ2CVN6_9DEIO|nr:hypothetical protein GCM10008938_09330 [Deinococcus roseus]